MASSIRKNLSPSFIVFFDTFLILSTVIIFAVLIYLSYENMLTDHISSTKTRCVTIAHDIVNDISSIALNDDYTVEEGSKYIESYVNSEIFSDFGLVYIVNDEGMIFYSNTNSPQGQLIGDEVIMDLLNSSKTLYENQSNRVRKTVVENSIADTGFHAVVVNYDDLSEVRKSYVSIVLFPSLVSMVTAIAMFVGFTGFLVTPIRAISKTINKVAEGDYSARIEDKYTNMNGNTSIVVSSDLAEMSVTVNSMIESLENMENDRNVFISSIAHDIRTPLTSINGFVTAMMDGTIGSDDYPKYLELIKSQVDRIRRLIVSMTEASSLSHVDPSLMEEFPVNEMISSIAEDLEPQLMDKDISIILKLDSTSDSMAYGEVGQLSRVIVNIVTNAIKFTPVGGKIKIETMNLEKDNKIQLSIADSGPGVEKEKRSRVFESFYKVDPSRKQEGFGLGLYICKMILMGHGQTIVLDQSKELGGAEFIFTLPYPPN